MHQQSEESWRPQGQQQAGAVCSAEHNAKENLHTVHAQELSACLLMVYYALTCCQVPQTTCPGRMQLTKLR